MNRREFERIKLDREQYVVFWRRAGKELLGWSETQVTELVRKWEDFIDDPTSLFDHETPSWYIVPYLVPETLRSCLSDMEREKLHAKLQQAIEQGDSACDLDNDYDWGTARQRIRDVLSESL